MPRSTNRPFIRGSSAANLSEMDEEHPGSRDFARLAGRYLRLADRLLPGRIAAFYVVGSAALGAYRAGRSDIDFVAVLDRPLTPAEIGRLRIVHVLSGSVSTI